MVEKNRCYAHGQNWKQRLWYFHREKVKRRGRNFFFSLSTRVSRSRFRYLGFAFDDRDPFFTRPLRFSSIIGAALEPIDGRPTAPTPPSSITFHQRTRTLCVWEGRGRGGARLNRELILAFGEIYSEYPATCFQRRVSRILIECLPRPLFIRLEKFVSKFA